MDFTAVPVSHLLSGWERYVIQLSQQHDVTTVKSAKLSRMRETAE